MSNEISRAEKNALAVSYEVLGTRVDLDLDFVKKYLVRGRAELTTDQELLFFMNTCKARNLNPLVGGEVYLIKYSKDQPAQLVVGKDAYLRRAFANPEYLSKKEGITVKRGNEILQKEGTCLYPSETLLGGWCRVFYLRHGEKCEAFKEVALAEYNSGIANWKTKPSTMITKVAVSQCVRDAFPNDYAGVYADDEMVASGAIPVVDIEAEDVSNEKVVAVDDPIITNEQRQGLFSFAKSMLGDQANDIIKNIVTGMGFTSTAELKNSDLEAVKVAIKDIISEPDTVDEVEVIA